MRNRKSRLSRLEEVISRYGKKKRGSFKVRECFMLCKLFGCTFEYLFKADQEA